MKNKLIQLNRLNIFKKRCLCRSQLFVMCIALVCIFLLMHIIDNHQNNTQLTYQQDLHIDHSVKIILPRAVDNRGDYDVASKLKGLYVEVKQKSDKHSHANVNEEGQQQKINLTNALGHLKENSWNSSQNNNEQRVVKLSDKPSEVQVNSNPSEEAYSQPQKATVKPNQTVLRVNSTHINGIPMEPVDAKYTGNIYFTMKTTNKYLSNRLFPLLLTWLQVVDKSKVSIITDKSAAGHFYLDTLKRAGYQIIDTDCPSTHSSISVFDIIDQKVSRIVQPAGVGRLLFPYFFVGMEKRSMNLVQAMTCYEWGLCCKMGTEFAAYYTAVEEHPGEENQYQWFCHSDDDVYINVPELSHFLQRYDHRRPYYIGKWPSSFYKTVFNCDATNNTVYRFSHELQIALKQRLYRYATGSAFCISQALMMEAKRFINGAKKFNKMSVTALPRIPDDMTVGLVIGTILGYNVTEASNMTNEYDVHVYKSNLKELATYLTISSGTTVNIDSLSKLASSLKTPLPSADPSRFLLYHCLLYPTISWCNSVRETLNIT